MRHLIRMSAATALLAAFTAVTLPVLAERTAERYFEAALADGVVTVDRSLAGPQGQTRAVTRSYDRAP